MLPFLIEAAMVRKVAKAIEPDDDERLVTVFRSPYHALLYRIILLAALDATEDGREDAVQFFGSWWFEYMAEHLDMNVRRWRQRVYAKVITNFPYYNRYDWFREQVEQVI